MEINKIQKVEKMFIFHLVRKRLPDVAAPALMLRLQRTPAAEVERTETV
jgi:hypothetical protein